MDAPLSNDALADDPAARVQALADKADGHVERREWAEAKEGLRTVLAEWQALGRLSEAAETALQLSHVTWMLQESEESLHWCQAAAELSAAADDAAGEGRAWLELAATFGRLGQWVESEAAARKAAARFVIARQLEHSALAESFRARALWRLERPNEAETALARAIRDLEASGKTEMPDGETLSGLRQQLARLRLGVFPEATRGTILPADEVEDLIQNTLAVMTVAQDRRAEWRTVVVNARADAAKRGAGWQVEVELFDALLALLDNAPATLSAAHPYAPTLATIRRGIAAGGPPEMPVDREVVEAVRAFVATEDWTSAQRLVEARQAVLLRPEVDLLFERNIAEAHASGDRRGERVLTLHRDVLRACRANGIEAGFAWLRGTLAEADARAEAARQHDALPPDLVDRAAAAFLGTSDEKLAFYSYLQGLSAFDHSLTPLARALQQAIFEDDPAPFGEQLSGSHAQVWRQIMARIRRSDAAGNGEAA